jgi:hypothetical protein
MSDEAGLTFVNEDLPEFIVGEYYEQTLQSVGGWGVVNFAVESGEFPDGIQLSAEGVISGTPTDDAGDTTVFITVTDENGDNVTQAFDCELAKNEHDDAASA